MQATTTALWRKTLKVLRKEKDALRAEVPGVRVSVIDITLPDAETPQSVFAVPTYILNDRTISLGNPAEGELLDRVAAVPSDEKFHPVKCVIAPHPVLYPCDVLHPISDFLADD